MNETKLMDFVNKAVGDAGALLAGSMVVLGDRLGCFRAMAGAGPITSRELVTPPGASPPMARPRPTPSRELATATGTAERHVREWLSAQAAAGYITYLGNG